MRDLENYPKEKSMYDKFENEFDRFIVDYAKFKAESIRGSLKENGYTFTKVMLTDEIKSKFQIDEEYDYVIIQKEATMGLITTDKVSKPPEKKAKEVSEEDQEDDNV